MAYIRQSLPDSGLGFQVKKMSRFHLVSSCLEAESPSWAARLAGSSTVKIYEPARAGLNLLIVDVTV